MWTDAAGDPSSDTSWVAVTDTTAFNIAVPFSRTDDYDVFSPSKAPPHSGLWKYYTTGTPAWTQVTGTLVEVDGVGVLSLEISDADRNTLVVGTNGQVYAVDIAPPGAGEQGTPASHGHQMRVVRSSRRGTAFCYYRRSLVQSECGPRRKSCPV
jgi:hypothetical protein